MKVEEGNGLEMLARFNGSSIVILHKFEEKVHFLQGAKDFCQFSNAVHSHSMSCINDNDNDNDNDSGEKTGQ